MTFLKKTFVHDFFTHAPLFLSGMFIAKISKGRTIKQFINGTMTAPVIYTFLWLVIFGGAGIRLERQSAGAGLCCPDKTNWFFNTTTLNETIFQRNVIGDLVVPESSYWMCDGDTCGSCAQSVLKGKGDANSTYQDFVDEFVYLSEDFGSVNGNREDGIRQICIHILPKELNVKFNILVFS